MHPGGLQWLAPLTSAFLDDANRSVWIPSAGSLNDWKGYYDRAFVVHASRVERVLNMMDAVSQEAHPFLDALKGFPGSTGRSTNCEHFWRQYLEARLVCCC